MTMIVDNILAVFICCFLFSDLIFPETHIGKSFIGDTLKHVSRMNHGGICFCILYINWDICI